MTLLPRRLLAACVLAAAAVTRPADADTVFRSDQAILDLREVDWHVVAEPDRKSKETPDSVGRRTDWSPIRVGRSWDMLGHEELRTRAVWLRIPVAIESHGDRIRFFTTAVGGAAEVFLNGKRVGGARYDWGSHVHGPTDLDLTEALRPGQRNELLVRCDPRGSIRSVGLLGQVCLYRTLPRTRTPEGGFAVPDAATGPFAVLLHHGSAVLSRGDQTVFGAGELKTLRLPPYALREDEMVQLLPAGVVDAAKLLRVDTRLIHHTTDDRELSVRCGPLPESVNQCERLTLPLLVTGTYRNPFEPGAIDVTAVVRTPSGEQETVHAFFGQDYEPTEVGEHEEVLLPVRGLGVPWRVHYRPRQTGRHEVQVRARSGENEVRFDAGHFTVVAAKQRGYLRVSRTDPRYFEFDNGETFYATGPSGWFRQQENWMFGGNTRWIPIRALVEYYRRKGRNRSSYEYLARWHFGRLDLPGGFIDNYVAWKLETAVRAMEANGLYWITYGLPGGGRAVYRGSPKSFESAGRIQLFHEIARFADSTALWLWNCCEETEAAEWMVPYHEYIRGLDIYGHPHALGETPNNVKAMADAATPDKPPETIRLGGDMLLLPDWYGRSLKNCIGRYRWLDGLPYPIVESEGGAGMGHGVGSLYNAGARIGPIARSFHHHLWLCLFLKMAGGGTHWGNNELDAAGQLFHAGAVARFLDGENLSNGRWRRCAVRVSEGSLHAFGLQAPGRTLIWVVQPDGKESGPVTVHVPLSRDGACEIECWDTNRGQVVKTLAAVSDGGVATVELAGVEGDVALKAVVRQADNKRP